jgi:hypothetical protein
MNGMTHAQQRLIREVLSVLADAGGIASLRETTTSIT